ncbi:MAG: DUF2244 domain-containing protein [Xanthomonadales bacterium]|nr:DUF2244 domain-containing protein [Xanthomonadales bacterium]
MPLSLPQSSDPAPVVVARPNRSATPRLLALVFVALALVSAVVVVFSVRQGNIWAPPFALVNLLAFGGCLALAWRRGDDEDRVSILDDRVEVTRSRRQQTERCEFNVHWVRVWLTSGTRPREHKRLLIGSHGRAIELGAFLNDEERSAFLAGLRDALAQATRPGWMDEQPWVSEGYNR